MLPGFDLRLPPLTDWLEIRYCTCSLIVLCILASSTHAEDKPKLTPAVPEQVRLSEILISTPRPYDPDQVADARRKADEVHDAILRGNAFEDLARAKSQGPTATRGGDLGYFRRGTLPQSIEDLVFGMKVGDTSDIVRTKQGFVILRVTDHLGPDDLPLEPKQLEWKEYVYPSAGFAITLPSDPHPHDDPTASGITVYTVHLLPRAVVTFRATSYRQDCGTGLNKTRELARSGAEPNLVKGSFKDVTVQGYSGLEWQLAVPAVGFAEYGRNVCVEGRFYIFEARWPVGKEMPHSIRRILNSLRFLGVPQSH
jgi:PPIC-type PPIASE domain